MRRYLFPIALLTLIAAVSSARAQAPDEERKIRNVTPKNIPVIILPPRNDKKADPRSAQDAPPVAGEEIKASVAENGAVSLDGKTIRFVGVTSLSNDTLCESATGGRWACGLRAYVALRNFIHGKGIRCEHFADKAETAISRCFREQTNISEWLLSEGWAYYDEDASNETLANAAREAEKNGRGVWANGSSVVSKR